MLSLKSINVCRSVSAGVLLAAADHNVFAFVLPKHHSPTCTLAKHIVYTHLKLAHKATGIFIRMRTKSFFIRMRTKQLAFSFAIRSTGCLTWIVYVTVK